MTLNIRTDAPTADHPIKVYYPFGGKMLMLHWYTDGDRGHVALAPTEDKLRAIARRVFEEHVSEVSIKSVCEIDIVAPSERLLVAAAMHNDKDRIEDFRRELTIEMRVAMDAGKTLPEPFAACDDYAFSSEEDRVGYTPDDDTREYYLDHHVGCMNCDMRVRLIGMTPRELYEKHHDRWRAAHPVKTYHVKGRPERAASRANTATNNNLWFAGADFGHHNKGVYLREIDYAELDSEYRPAYISENVLFYFQRLRGLPELDETLTSMRSDIDEAWARRERDKDALRAVSAEREKIRQADKVVSFFKGES